MRLLQIRWIPIAMLSVLAACASGQNREAPVRVGDDALILDVRTQQEFAAGHIAGATLIPYDVIGDRIHEVASDHDQEIVVYCRSGRRSGIAQRTLQELGYTNVRNAGGLASARELLEPKEEN